MSDTHTTECHHEDHHHDHSAGESLETEWVILHEGIEKYERPALALKAGALILTLVFLFTPLSSLWFISLTLLIWLQEGIWRTSQARMEQRILHVERALQMNETVTEPFQMYSQWQTYRGSQADLVAEYLANARRPTVAYPYLVMIILTLLAWVF